MGYSTLLAIFRRKAPYIIAVAIVLALAIYVSFEILTDAGSIMSFTHDVTQTIKSMGYYGVFGLMVLEASSLPIPSEVILPFAGYLISTGQYNLDFILMILVSTVAAIVGSLVDYYIGLKGIQALTKYRIMGRCIFSESHLNTVSYWFSRYGTAMVLLGRLIPVFRTLISFPAGAVRMPLTKFIAYTIVGCVVWNTLLIYVGYYLGSNWEEVADVSHYLIMVAVTAFAGVGVWWFIRRRRRIAACMSAKAA